MNLFRSLLVSVLAAAVMAISAPAQDHPEHPEHPKKETANAAVIEATLEGENFCLGCSLKEDKGAAAQCSKYGHRHALKVTAATIDGKDRPEMKGWVLHYLDTDNAQPVIKEHHGETVMMTGKVYSEERVLEVGKLEETKGAKKPEHPEHPK